MSDAADILTSRDTLSAECTIEGETITVEFDEPTKGELDDLDATLADDAEEADEAALIIDEYLSHPDVDSSDLGVTKLLAVYGAFERAIAQSDAIQNAREKMVLDEGNR